MLGETGAGELELLPVQTLALLAAVFDSLRACGLTVCDSLLAGKLDGSGAELSTLQTEHICVP